MNMIYFYNMKITIISLTGRLEVDVKYGTKVRDLISNYPHITNLYNKHDKILPHDLAFRGDTTCYSKINIPK